MVDLFPLVVFATCPLCEDEELFFYESAGDSRIHFTSFGKGHNLSDAALMPHFERVGLVQGR